MSRITKETTDTGFKVKNIKQCGQCTKSSCYGCTNYVQGKAQQTPTSSIILTELAKVSGLVLLVFILFIII